MATRGQSAAAGGDSAFDLKAHEKETINKAFSRLDRNGDGRISRDELKAGLILLGETPTKERLEELFGATDGNANGYIEQEEFKSMMAEKFIENRLKNAYTQAAFQMFDKNNDGYITPDEISQVVNDVGFDLSSGGLTEMIRTADTNKDGKINYKEFSKALWKKTSSQNGKS